MFSVSNFICGEKFQFECDTWIGTRRDFDANPRVKFQLHRQMDIDRLNQPWENPPTIFCYSYLIPRLCEKLATNLILRPFVLVTHNSAHTMSVVPEENRRRGIACPIIYLLGHHKVVRWFSSNVNHDHPKLKPLPLGLANPQHPHGNSVLVSRTASLSLPQTRLAYLNFDTTTKPDVRNKCMEVLLAKGFTQQPALPFEDYVRELASHKYCFCPPGHALDTHRLWECLYLGVVPIVLRSTFVELLDRYVIPNMMFIVDKWEDVPATPEELEASTKALRTIRKDPGIAFILSSDLYVAAIHFGITA
jgi:hypothetical protein